MSGPGVSHRFPPKPVSWLKRDALLFANSIGVDPDELHFLYENHPEFTIFPTYPVVLPFKGTSQETVDYFAPSSDNGPIPGVPTFDRARVVDGERRMTIHRPLPVSSEGRAFELRAEVAGVYDKGKGSGTVLERVQRLVEVGSGKEEVYATMVMSLFFVGQGGWGGPRGPPTPKYPPPQDRVPDAVVDHQTTAMTPLLYRLNGDYNPLHAAPEQGARMGFSGVIIHGLFAWNQAAHAVLRALGGSEPANLREFQGRFAAPVRPGDRLTTMVWRMGTGWEPEGGQTIKEGEGEYEEVRFVVRKDDGKVVISNGRALVRVIGKGRSKL